MAHVSRAATSDVTTSRRSETLSPAIVRTAERFSKPFGFFWNRGLRMLGVLDAVGLYALMVIISVVRFDFGFSWPTYPMSHYWIGFSIATAIHLIVNYFAGLYEREPRLGRRPWLPRVTIATGIGVAVQAAAFVVLDRYLMPRLNLAVFALLASSVLVANRSLSRWLTRAWQGPPRVVLAGDHDACDVAEDHLLSSDRAAVVVARTPVGGDLVRSIRRSEATDVLMLDVTAFGSVYPEPLTSLEASGVGFLQRVGARETLLGLRVIREIGGMPFVPLRSHAVPTHKIRLKRIFDLVLIIALSPIWIVALALLALWVRARAGSGVLFRQRRVGREGVEFTCIKFRTMIPDAEEDGRARLATKDDDRVVRGLGWMRSTRLDELPQLFNVLQGDMSLVGPRPERPELVAEIARRVPGYVRRDELPPGITGLAQVNGRYATDAEFKLGYDIQYLVNWSLLMDVQILLRTIWVVVARRV
ncbi:MAG: exopolysaccharide biosynthesis polyprenyl glycosylphosphotransferase [Actinomycetota bacterium]